MEVQSLSAPLFVPIDQRTSNAIINHPITFQTICSLKADCPIKHTLKLISQTLLLQQQQSLPLVLQLDFDVKFEVLHREEKNAKSQKIGIRLCDQLERELKIYTDVPLVEQWSLLLGRKINRKGFHEMFKPTRKLGKGNFATVYEAERLSDHAKFAVKAFKKDHCFSSKHGRESLINQLTVLRELNLHPHPNIIALEGVYESDNSIYVVLELLTGKTLYQAMEDRGAQFTKGQVRNLIQGLLKGLKHMHDRRFMHRDLKPENIMLRGESLEPVIVDFGLATHADVSEYLFFRCGTPGYVAPQIIKLTQSEHIEPSCDIFSLGAIFHILLSRKTLFAGTKFDQVYSNNKEFRMDLEGQHLSHVSANARDLLRKMLVLDPMERITAGQALNHAYFSDQAEDQNELKIASPVLTSAGSYKDPTIKRMGLLFY